MKLLLPLAILSVGIGHGATLFADGVPTLTASHSQNATATAAYGSVHVSALAMCPVQFCTTSIVENASASFSDTLSFFTGLGGGFISFDYTAGGCCNHGLFQYVFGTQGIPISWLGSYGTTALQPFQDLVGIPVFGQASVSVGTMWDGPSEFGNANVSILGVHLFDASMNQITSFSYSSASGSAYAGIGGTFADDDPVGTFDVATPEPSTWILMSSGLAGMLIARKRKGSA